jgi:hypothetical protein
MMNPVLKEPFLLDFDQIGDKSTGFLVTTQEANRLPFAVKRVFWTFDTPAGRERGGHANKLMEEILVAIRGEVQVTLRTIKQEEYSFVLDSPARGLYVPPFCWITIRLAENSILLSLASTDFEEADYIRDYADFCNYKPAWKSFLTGAKNRNVEKDSR